MNLQEWLISSRHLNEVLNAEKVNEDDNYVVADQSD